MARVAASRSSLPRPHRPRRPARLGRARRAGPRARLVPDAGRARCGSRSRACSSSPGSSSSAARSPRWFVIVVGLLLGVLLVVRILDAAFLTTLYRPFNPLDRLALFGSATELLGDSAGPVTAVLIVSRRGCSGRAARPDPGGSASGRTARRPAPHGCAARARGHDARLGRLRLARARLSVDLPTASSSTAGPRHPRGHRPCATACRTGTPSQRRSPSTRSATPRRRELLAGCAARTSSSSSSRATAGSPSTRVRRRRSLATGTTGLRGAGYSTRERVAHLPDVRGDQLARPLDPPVGGLGEQPAALRPAPRHRLSATPRLTLARAFSRAGWRTVDVIPANRHDWPEGRAFYGYDEVYDARTLGYAGPASATHRCPTSTRCPPSTASSSSAGHVVAPVMAEIDLVTSHVPWAPLPRLVDWASVGDGSGFVAHPAQALAARPGVEPRPACGRPSQTVAYSLDSSCRSCVRPRRRQPRPRAARRPPALRWSPATPPATGCRSPSSPPTRA